MKRLQAAAVDAGRAAELPTGAVGERPARLSAAVSRVRCEQKWRSDGHCERLRHMGKAAVDISKLSREEQLELLDQLWESLGRDSGILPLTHAHRQELDRRLDDLEEEGPVGIAWDDLVDQIRARSR
jgi:putative addiction module component (TIGR02574 family)